MKEKENCSMCFKIEGHPALELSKIKIILCSSLGATIF